MISYAHVEYILQNKHSLDVKIKYTYTDTYWIGITGGTVHKRFGDCLRQLKINIENVIGKANINSQKYISDNKKK